MQPKPPLRKRSTMHCPNCGKLVSIKAEKCVHCGHARPGRFVGVPVFEDLLTGRISFSEGLVVVCFLLYVLAVGLSGLNAFQMSNGVFSLLSPGLEPLYMLGMGGRIPWQTGRWWTLVTATFLHGGILHIGFNMLWLRRIGPWVEELFGNSRFLIIYIIAGLTGSILTTLMGTNFFIGASGAIFGLFGALIYYGRARGGTFGAAIFREMALWAVIGFALGFFIPNVDNWGHAGGFIGGVLTAWVVKFNEYKKESLRIHWLAVFILVFVLTCFGFMLFAYFTN